MVNFSKALKKKDVVKKINPVEIYYSLDRKSAAGPLRPIQENILTEWFEEKKDDRDLIIKLHTGAGKTLIGLLILQSKLNLEQGPCLYICPNKYLVSQVCEDAEKFGINYCCIGEDNELPEEFLLGKSILITYVQKMFNGKTVFGLGGKSEKIGTIILDDSHACIDSINDSCTIKINKKDNEELYNKLITLFDDDLNEQGEGTLIDIKNEEFESLLAIPYWAWNEKKSEVLKILSDYKESAAVKYVWPIIKDNIGKCRGIVNGKQIEISPNRIPIKIFGSFNNANNRILMSATTQNDSFFIKGLNLGINAIKNPIQDKTLLWSGEKMILLPSLIDDSCNREEMVALFAKETKNHIGIVSLVPSFQQGKFYEKYGANLANSNNIFELINELKEKKTKKTLVIANRYDGIDLPDDSCRILILDSLPYSSSLYDIYQENCRATSEIVNVKIAQKIEQGLGRSVRGEKDYSTIIMIGADLVKFVKSKTNRKYFSKQTQQQIAIGQEIVDLARAELKEGEISNKVIIDLINQCLKRDEGWKNYYSEQMDEINNEYNESGIDKILTMENQAEEAYDNEEYEKACDKIQEILDLFELNDIDKGWYLQELAKYKYHISKVESNRIQKSAFMLNRELLKPREGISYNKIEFINESRIARIKKWISEYESFSELNLQVNNILEQLSFGRTASVFEGALDEIGKLLGFICDRPDKMIRKGPDNLWCIGNNEFIMFECKSEVSNTRNEITKTEVGQMNNHCGWFEREYRDAKVLRILIIPTKNVSYCADFTHDVKIMRKGKLRDLKNNIKSFIKEFKNYHINELSDEKINGFLVANRLDVKSIKEIYHEEYNKNNK